MVRTGHGGRGLTGGRPVTGGAYRRRAAVGLVAVVLAAAAGCDAAGEPTAGGTAAGPSAGGAAPGSTVAPTASTPSGSSGLGTAPGDPTTAPSGGGTARCTADHLRVTFGQGGVAAGTWATVLVLRNAGDTACQLRGYPGVAGLDATGRQVTQARRTAAGSAGGLADPSAQPPLVTLAPGATGSALLEGSNVPRGSATTCPTYQGLLVTPPDETWSVRLTTRARGCSGLEIHPVVPGVTGSQRR
ncbi:DUF4232 domain-containing protein [Micromonospora sp. NPDC000089]|uniref:DUF4232 domain-containing protein n=1 Tax=unclassified Micromonospora TaxID=2617518 RepID=UPI0036B942B8